MELFMIDYRQRVLYPHFDAIPEIRHFALTRAESIEWISEQSAVGIQRRKQALRAGDFATVAETDTSDIEWIMGDDGTTIVAGRTTAGQYDIHPISIASALNLLLLYQ